MTTLVRLACALALLAAATPANAWSPERRDETPIKADFAVAFGVAPELVVEAHYYEIRDSPKMPGFILGRFREKAGAEWVFPGVAVYFQKPGEKRKDRYYLSRTWLGSASERLTAVALVDLDEARRVLDLSGDRWRSADRPAAKQRRTWPALLVAAERTHAPPQKVDLVVVSLKDPAEPAVLLEQALLSRWPDATREEMEREHRPPDILLGHAVERITVERDGKTRRLRFVERGIDSRWNGCLAPEPYERVFTLAPGALRFTEEPWDGPPRPCH